MSGLAPAPLNLDVVAEALTPDVIVPYDVPVRTIPLGTREGFWIREGYRSRDAASDDGAASTATGSADAITGVNTGIDASVDGLVQRLGQAVGADRVHTSIDALCAHGAPDLLVRELAASLGRDQLLVIATPVRAFTSVSDHPGPPDEPSRRREWTFPELQVFLDAEGLDVVFGGIAARTAGERGSETAVMIAVGRAPSRAQRAP